MERALFGVRLHQPSLSFPGGFMPGEGEGSLFVTDSNNTDRRFASDVAIIAHGDGDGTIAAAICRRAGAEGRLTVTAPNQLHKLPDLTDPVVIVDLAVDNKALGATLGWAARNAPFIVAWVDHHAGGEGLADILGEKFLYDSSKPSCPALMAERGFDVPADWLDAANACDAPTQFATTTLAERYNAAFKATLAVDVKKVAAIQVAFVEELTSGQESPLVTKQAEKYPVLSAATDAAVKELVELVPGVGHVGIEGGQGSVDITQVMVRGYPKFPTIVITTISAEDESPITLIGTNRKAEDLNLLTAFGLGSGNPSRVVLKGHDLDRVRAVLGS